MMIRLYRVRAAAFLVLGLASCQAGPHATGSGPASAQAATPSRVVLKLYSGSSTGLVVGEAPAGGNPASLLPGQSFVENPGLGKTFIWSFAAGATMLDASCAVITHTQAINIANAPVANAAVFIETAADGGQAPGLKVQILPARTASGANC